MNYTISRAFSTHMDAAGSQSREQMLALHNSIMCFTLIKVCISTELLNKPDYRQNRASASRTYQGFDAVYGIPFRTGSFSFICNISISFIVPINSTYFPLRRTFLLQILLDLVRSTGQSCKNSNVATKGPTIDSLLTQIRPIVKLL